MHVRHLAARISPLRFQDYVVNVVSYQHTAHCTDGSLFSPSLASLIKFIFPCSLYTFGIPLAYCTPAHSADTMTMYGAGLSNGFPCKQEYIPSVAAEELPDAVMYTLLASDLGPEESGSLLMLSKVIHIFNFLEYFITSVTAYRCCSYSNNCISIYWMNFFLHLNPHWKADEHQSHVH